MATTLKGPKPHPTKWTLVFTQAELEKALVRGDRAYILPPRAEWAGKR